ncbi:hypothetical protein ACG93S_06810 [Streptomyces sp. WAC01490]|uniref:hypothetical protein n=1 Tax=unclassified Streptomyces TaxID=2593676 RepID=UPI003F33BDC1
MPARTTPGLTFTRHDGDAAREIVDELNAVYAEVYGVPPYAGDPFFSVETFADRLTAAFTMRGFEVVTARLDDGTLVGYVHGVTLTPGRTARGGRPSPMTCPPTPSRPPRPATSSGCGNSWFSRKRPTSASVGASTT